jgi:nucleoside-diphosphate-sugar epimerase
MSLNKRNILITGASGLIGPALAARLLQDPQFRVILTDIVPPAVPPGAAHPENAECIAADLCDAAGVAALVARAQPLAAAFLFHGIMSAGSEADPALALRVNVDATRGLLLHLAEACRGVRVVLASSNAVYGPPLPELVTDATMPTPTGVYGTCKLMAELLVNDLTRRGGIDGFSVRFPTVSVRPGKPTAAASSFLSGIIREPMKGMECIVPLRDRDYKTPLCSPRVCVENLVRVLDWRSDVLPPHIRSVNFPGIVASVQDMRDALAKFGGEDKLQYIKEVEDEVAEKLLKSWACYVDYSTPLRLGLVKDESVESLVKEYIDGLTR